MKRVIAQVLYFFESNEIIEKKFLREVVKETEKSYMTDTNEILSKKLDNKFQVLYGNTVVLWKSALIEENKDMEQIRKELCKELTQDTKEFLTNKKRRKKC